MISTIREWLASILGEYTPVTYTVRLISADGTASGSYTEVASGLAGVDWEYLATAALLLIAVWSVFRLLGVLLQSLSGGKG